VLEDLPDLQSLSMLETAVHLDEKVKYFEQRNAWCKEQFHQTDLELDQIRAEALEQESHLVNEREEVREVIRDVNFADEQMELRIERK